MKEIHLGKKEEDLPMAVAIGIEKEGEHFPTAYISHEDMPKLKVGDEVVLHGKVTSFNAGERDGKDGKTKHRDCEVEIHKMQMDGKDDDEPKESDEDAVEKGLKETESKKDSKEEEEEED